MCFQQPSLLRSANLDSSGFEYRFPDGSLYHLNMYPLRKKYVQRLMHEVGFQQVETYGDFQETYRDKDPDFFVHIAEKMYHPERKA